MEHEIAKDIHQDHAHYRPISARFPARVKVVIGGAPMTLLSHRRDPNAVRAGCARGWINVRVARIPAKAMPISAGKPTRDLQRALTDSSW
jgi:hypothetical protein